jgi:hypothetical protein
MTKVTRRAFCRLYKNLSANYAGRDVIARERNVLNVADAVEEWMMSQHL